MNAATVTSLATSRASVALEHACLCARLAADHKAREILVLDMRGQTPLYDFFVIVTGTSRRQLHVLTEEIDLPFSSACSPAGSPRAHAAEQRWSTRAS